jgi:hypothetical protein
VDQSEVNFNLGIVWPIMQLATLRVTNNHYAYYPEEVNLDSFTSHLENYNADGKIEYH